jgi:membrane protease YdiL (CAAX protease family)
VAGSGLTQDRPNGARPSAEQPILTRGVIFAILIAYAAGFALTALSAGPRQAARDFGAEGLILFLWLLAVRLLMRGQPVIEAPARRPRPELAAGLTAVPILAAGASLYYLGQPLFIYFNLAVIYTLPLVILAMQPDRQLAFGLRLPSKRAWLALLAVIGINIAVGITLGSVLPAGELPTPPGSDLAEELTSAPLVLLLLVQLVVRAALPEELFFRVYLQPRLSCFMPAGWAILLQALLFSAVHLPQALISYAVSWPLGLAGVFMLANGLIAGCLWSRTRSLPLLVLLHVFAFPRIGL